MSRWAKSPVSLKLSFSVLPRILIRHFECKRSRVDWTKSSKNTVKPFVMQGTEWLVAVVRIIVRSSFTRFTRAEVPSAVTDLYALMLMPGHSRGQDQLVRSESFCVKVWEASSVFKIISCFWLRLFDSIGCVKKLEFWRDFIKWYYFKRFYHFPTGT